jgi:hypothetical protein
MRPIGSSRPNKLISAAVFGVLIAIAAFRIGGAQSNEFRFEDYTRGEYRSKHKGDKAAKAHLYQLFPKGSHPKDLSPITQDSMEMRCIAGIGIGILSYFTHPLLGSYIFIERTMRTKSRRLK